MSPGSRWFSLLDVSVIDVLSFCMCVAAVIDGGCGVDEAGPVEDLHGVAWVVGVEEDSDFLSDEVFVSFVEDVVDAEGAVTGHDAGFFPAEEFSRIDMLRQASQPAFDVFEKAVMGRCSIKGGMGRAVVFIVHPGIKSGVEIAQRSDVCYPRQE